MVLYKFSRCAFFSSSSDFGLAHLLQREQVTMRNMGAIVRKLDLREVGTEGPMKEVTHIQFRDWPDGGIPADRDDFKAFILYLVGLSRSLRDREGGAVLVHCFGMNICPSFSFFLGSTLICVICVGGKGRTGTTIATLLELQKVERFGVTDIDVCGTVSEMRTW